MTPSETQKLSLETRMKQQFLDGIAGDENAYTEFLELAAKIVRANLRHTFSTYPLRSPEALEDLVQDVLLSVHRKRHTFRPDYRILPWLFAIARHRGIDITRMLATRPNLLDGDGTALDGVADPEAEWRSDRAEAEIEARAEVDAMLERLSSKQREMIRMAKLEELPHAEIAKKLGISLGAVKIAVHRAMQRLGETEGTRK